MFALGLAVKLQQRASYHDLAGRGSRVAGCSHTQGYPGPVPRLSITRRTHNIEKSAVLEL